MDFKRFIRNRVHRLDEKFERDLHSIIRQITRVDDTSYGYENKMGHKASVISRNLGVALRDLNIDVNTTKFVKIPNREIGRMRADSFTKSKVFSPKTFVERLKLEMMRFNTNAMIVIANKSFDIDDFISSDEIYVLAKKNRLLNPGVPVEEIKGADVVTFLQISKDSDDYRKLSGKNRGDIYTVITSLSKVVDGDTVNNYFGSLNIKAIWCLSDDDFNVDTFNAKRGNTVRDFEYDTADDNPMIKKSRKDESDCDECGDKCCEKCGSALCDGTCDGCCECGKNKCNESCVCVSFSDDLPCSFLQIPCDRLGCDYCDCSDLLGDEDRYEGINPDKFIDDDPNDDVVEDSEEDDDEPNDDVVEDSEEDDDETSDNLVDDETDDDSEIDSDDELEDEEDNDSEEDELEDDEDEDEEDNDSEEDELEDDEDEDDELEEEDDEDEEDEEEDVEDDEDAEELNENNSPFCIKNIIREFYNDHSSSIRYSKNTVEQQTNMFLQVLTDVISTEKHGIQKDRTSGRGRSLLAHNPKTSSINLNLYQLSPIHLRDVARIKCIYQQPTFVGYFMFEPLNHNRITIFSFDYDDMKYIVRTYTMQNQSGSTVVDPRKGDKAYARPLHDDDIETRKIDKVYNRDDKLANVFNKDNIICGALIKGSPSTSSAGICIKNALKALYGEVAPMSNKSQTLVQWHLINLILQKSINKTDFTKAIKEWKVVGYKTGRTSCVCGYENITLGYKIRNEKNGEVIYPIGAKCIKAFAINDEGNFVKSETSPENLDNGWGQRARNFRKSGVIDYNYDEYEPDTRSQEDSWRDYIRDTKFGTDDYIGDVRQTRWKELRKQGYRD